MRKILQAVCYWPLSFLAVFLLTECRREVDNQLTVDFTFSVIDSNYNSPAKIVFTNLTKGALFFRWSFIGGDTITSGYKDPGLVTFTKAGKITVTLEAWNDAERKQNILEIIVDTVPDASFTATPRLNAYSPTEWDFAFTGKGATVYNWMFEQGNPLSSTERNPRQIRYTAPRYVQNLA